MPSGRAAGLPSASRAHGIPSSDLSGGAALPFQTVPGDPRLGSARARRSRARRMQQARGYDVSSSGEQETRRLGQGEKPRNAPNLSPAPAVENSSRNSADP